MENAESVNQGITMDAQLTKQNYLYGVLPRAQHWVLGGDGNLRANEKRENKI